MRSTLLKTFERGWGWYKNKGNKYVKVRIIRPGKNLVYIESPDDNGGVPSEIYVPHWQLLPDSEKEPDS